VWGVVVAFVDPGDVASGGGGCRFFLPPLLVIVGCGGQLGHTAEGDSSDHLDAEGRACSSFWLVDKRQRQLASNGRSDDRRDQQREEVREVGATRERHVDEEVGYSLDRSSGIFSAWGCRDGREHESRGRGVGQRRRGV